MELLLALEVPVVQVEVVDTQDLKQEEQEILPQHVQFKVMLVEQQMVLLQELLEVVEVHKVLVVMHLLL